MPFAQILGFFMVTAGFLAASLATVRDEKTIQWQLYALGLATGVVGVAMARLSALRVARDEKRMAGSIERIRSSLGNIERNLSELNARRDEVDIYDLRVEIDARFMDDINAFVESRESLADRYGIQAYADLMSHFAAGERCLNRVWCCSADGYIDEARLYLDRAGEEFVEVRRRLQEIETAPE